MSRSQIRRLNIDMLEDRRLLAVVAGDAGIDEAIPQSEEVSTEEVGRLSHNESMPLDVNGDLNVSAVDLLMIVNHLNDPSASGGFLDTSGDNSVSPIDGLLVLNHLNNSAGAAESESAAKGASTRPVEEAFKIKGGGVLAFFPPIGEEAPHTIEGQATHLGQHEGLGWVRPIGLAAPDDPRLLPGNILAAEFDNSRPTVFEAANGDELHYDYGRAEGTFSPGIVQLFPDPDEPGKVFAVFIAEFTPIVGASTGRFEKVVGGSFDMTATTESFALGDPENPPVDIGYSWSGSGTIEFSRGRR